jgi:lipoyl(octanoyl) transferase
VRLVEQRAAAVLDRPIDTVETGPLAVRWLGRVDYRTAWAFQKRLAAERADGLIGDQLLLLEHPAVLTLGRQASESFVRVEPAELERRGIALIRVERGGEVTYHGPGQLVAYPILALSRRGLLVRPLVRALETAMVAACRAAGAEAESRPGHPGCWCDVSTPGRDPRKIGALGIRIERGVSYHGIALNVGPDLGDFDLIDACGMPEVISTSIAAEIGRPGVQATTEDVAWVAASFAVAFAEVLGASLVGDLPTTRRPSWLSDPAGATTRASAGG